MTSLSSVADIVVATGGVIGDMLDKVGVIIAVVDGTRHAIVDGRWHAGHTSNHGLAALFAVAELTVVAVFKCRGHTRILVAMVTLGTGIGIVAISAFGRCHFGALAGVGVTGIDEARFSRRRANGDRSLDRLTRRLVAGLVAVHLTHAEIS